MSTDDSLVAWMEDADAEPGALEDEARLARLRRRMFDASDTEVRLGKYRDLEEIGRGGMSVVYRARDQSLGRDVAIKLLRRSGGPSQVPRLQREAQAMAQLSHANVVQVLEVGEYEGESYVVMELVEGANLAQWLAAADRPWTAVLAVFAAAGEGLAAAHSKGLVHRDFKPSNVMIGHDERVRVTDFGLARFEQARPTPPSGPTPADDSALDSVTVTGARLGTPRYMAPEQRWSAQVDNRADQWAFAVSLWEALYGQHPFVVDGRMLDPSSARPHAPRHNQVPAAIGRVLAVALRNAPKQRYGSMRGLLRHLHAAAGRRRRLRLGVGVALVASIGALVTRASGDAKQCRAAPGSAEVWSSQRRAQLAKAFAATALPFAARAWADVDARVGPWVQAWDTEYARVCQRSGTLENAPAADRQLLCLRGQLWELRALLDAFEVADANVVGRAERATRNLPRPQQCQNATHAPLAEAAALRLHTERMARARGMARAGRYHDAAALAEEAVEADNDEPRLLLQAQLSLGMNRKRAGELETSGDPLRAAYYGASAAGSATLATDAALSMLQLSIRRSELQEAEQWSRHAASWLGRVEHGRKFSELQRELSIGRAELLSSMGRYDDAIDELDRTWALCGRDEASPMAPRWMDLVGGIQLSRGDYVSAQQYFVRATEIETRRSGRNHPQTANSICNLGNAHWYQADYEAAERAYQEAYEIRMVSLGPQNPKTAINLMNIGLLAHVRGDYSTAIDHFERAAQTLTATLGPGHPQTALALSNLGSTLSAMGDWERSNAVQREVLEIYEARLGDEHADVASALHNLAAGLTEVGRHAEAIRLHTRALAIVDKVHGKSHLLYASGLHNMAVVLRRMGDYEAAEQHERRALTRYEQALGPEHPELALVYVGLAQNALRQARFDDAILLAAHARALGPRMALSRGLSAFFLAQGLRGAAQDLDRIPVLLDEADQEFSDAGRAAMDNLIALRRWRADNSRTTATR